MADTTAGKISFFPQEGGYLYLRSCSSIPLWIPIEAGAEILVNNGFGVAAVSFQGQSLT